MLRLPNLAISLLVMTLASPLASGKVGNVFVPSQAKAGTGIEVKIQFIGSPVTYDDLSATFGIKPSTSPTCGNCLGSRVGYVTLLDNPSVPPVGNASFTVYIPDYLSAGLYVFGTGIARLVGINGAVDFQFYTQDMTISTA